jgi:hypothetical protein
MIERGAEYWGGIYGRVEDLERRGFMLRHGGLSRLLEEEGGVDKACFQL